MRDYLIRSLKHCTHSKPPPQFCFHLPAGAESKWDENTIRTALNLFLSIVPLDHSLIHHFATIYGKSPTEVKRVSVFHFSGLFGA